MAMSFGPINNPTTTFNAPSNVKGQLAGLALTALQTLAPKILPQGIDTSFSGVGLGKINLGAYGAGSALPSPYSQLQGSQMIGNQYAATKPMYQDMYATQRGNRLLDYQTMQDAMKPNLTWAAMQAPAQSQRIFGASKGNYYDRMGMAAMADAAKWAAQTPRAFGRQGVSNTPNFA
tara:strand:- start:55 stop:582 length:528 start_codon:yes stop_codon:yes gene_type:complete